MEQIGSIAIVGGTGAEGRGLALRFAAAGFNVIIGSRDHEKAAKVVADLNGKLPSGSITASSNEGAVAVADLTILTVPYAAQRATVEQIREPLYGKILVDATAPLVPPKVSRVQLPAGGSSVAAIQSMLGEAVRVVSAFQNVSAHKLQDLSLDVECDVLVCADDAAARSAVIALVEKVGLRGIDAGPICNAAAAEALTSILIHINRTYKVPGSGIRITGLAG